MLNIPRSQPRKLATTTVTNKLADGVNALAQLFHVGAGQDQQEAIETLLMKRTGAIGGQAGRWNAKSFREIVHAKGNATGAITFADFGTAQGNDDLIIWQIDAVQDLVVGRFLGFDSASHKPIYALFGGTGETSSPKVLSGSGTSADSTTWDRFTDKSAVQVQVGTRVVWDGTAHILYGFYRTWTFDSMWKLATIGAETRYIIDSAQDCTT
jgi:hypothetical protein